MKLFSVALAGGCFASVQAATWHVLQNENAVYDTTPTTPGIHPYGKTDTWQDCQAAADKANVTIFTWHDQNQAGYEHDCWFRTDGVFQPTAQSGHVSGTTGPVPPSQDEFDCAWRKFAYEHGRKLIPRAGNFESLYYALNLNNFNGTDPIGCNETLPPSDSDSSPKAAASSTLFASPEDLPADALFVCAASGNDRASGAIHQPLRSLHAATERALKTESRTVVLRDAAPHYLRQQLVLTPRHSGLTIVSYPGENAVVSGGKELKVDWQPYAVSATSNIYVADVSGQVETIPGLQLDGARATRAR